MCVCWGGGEAAAARPALILEVWWGWCQVTRSKGNRIQMIEEEHYGEKGPLSACPGCYLSRQLVPSGLRLSTMCLELAEGLRVRERQGRDHWESIHSLGSY